MAAAHPDPQRQVLRHAVASCRGHNGVRVYGTRGIGAVLTLTSVPRSVSKLLTNLMQLLCNHKQLRAPLASDCRSVMVQASAVPLVMESRAGADLDGRANHEKRREEFNVIAAAKCSGRAVIGSHSRHLDYALPTASHACWVQPDGGIASSLPCGL